MKKILYHIVRILFIVVRTIEYAIQDLRSK
jgi:hypothetical protein